MKRRSRSSSQGRPVAEKALTLTARAIGARGDALCTVPETGETVFVPGLLPGEAAEILARGERGRIARRLTTSDERVEPFCSVAEKCGGCSLQHWQHDAYRRWKRALVADALSREGLNAPLLELVDAGGQGRRRVALHARKMGTRLLLGFTERAGQAIADTNDCPVAEARIRKSFPALRELAMAVLNARHDTAIIAVTATEPGLDVHVDRKGEVTLDDRLTGGELLAREGWARLTIGRELIAEGTPPIVHFGKAKVAPPPGGFLQATDAGEAVLAAIVMEALDAALKVAPKESRHVIDLYAGSGAFALRMAERAPVRAVEGEAAPLAALDHAARHTPGLKPVSVLRRDLAREPLSIRELSGAAMVVVDPPRAGAKEQMELLAGSGVPVIVSISCNPSTFARDAAILVRAGYTMGPVTPVDQFVHTAHVECASVFTKG
ncbi:MAG: class I SAM-dependent RNA methyltransferase [Caulobacterales bacterium]|uniref:class I SAM-dependent RNA methyltransferase n=1 Tax=Glycocaulis sp. TaxID=1969725 RepID=UPI003F9F3F48